MVGGRIGGVNVFGGGLALYNASGRLLGGLGVSGDSSCADHNIAWRTRNTLNLDYVPRGVSRDADPQGQHRLRHHAAARPDAGRQRERMGPSRVLGRREDDCGQPPRHALAATRRAQRQRAKGTGKGKGLFLFALCPLPSALCPSRILSPEAVVRDTLCLFAALLALVNPAFSQTLPRGVQQKASLGGITEYAYPNGLRVLLFPDPSNPKVTVNMTYLVGSRFEGYGETGMAHLLEHLNFIRSTQQPRHQEGTDRPRRAVERQHGLRPHQLFRDRHGQRRQPAVGARPRSRAHGQHADGEGAARHRDDRRPQRVRARREQRPERPRRARRRDGVSLAQLRQVGRSARAPIIERVPIDRLAAFYRKYYQPDNAVLVIAGQFDASKALAMVADTLGAIPRPTRTLDAPYTVEPAQDGERFVELRRVDRRQVVMAAWHAPALAHPDSAALEVLTGIMVSGGGGRGGGAGTGRLYKALVDSKKALDGPHERPGAARSRASSIASATLSNDQSLDDVRKTMLDTIAAVATRSARRPTRSTRAKTRILQGMETRMANSQQAALGADRNHRGRRLASAISSTTIRSRA